MVSFVSSRCGGLGRRAHRDGRTHGDPADDGAGAMVTTASAGASDRPRTAIVAGESVPFLRSMLRLQDEADGAQFILAAKWARRAQPARRGSPLPARRSADAPVGRRAVGGVDQAVGGQGFVEARVGVPVPRSPRRRTPGRPRRRPARPARSRRRPAARSSTHCGDGHARTSVPSLVCTCSGPRNSSSSHTMPSRQNTSTRRVDHGSRCRARHW